MCPYKQRKITVKRDILVPIIVMLIAGLIPVVSAVLVRDRDMDSGLYTNVEAVVYGVLDYPTGLLYNSSAYVLGTVRKALPLYNGTPILVMRYRFAWDGFDTGRRTIYLEEAYEGIGLQIMMKPSSAVHYIIASGLTGYVDPEGNVKEDTREVIASLPLSPSP